jgi:hypothetical protein
MWVPPEDKDPVLWHAPTRKSVAWFGAVNLRSGKLVTRLTSPFDTETFNAFLQLLARHRRRVQRPVAILDNAADHRAAVAPESWQLDYLPPYSPALNPIERVWKLLRRLRLH